MAFERRAVARFLLDEMAEILAAHRGRVEIFGAINAETERLARRAIDRAWNADVIEVLINSHGGDVGAANRIAQDLRQVGLPVVARVQGLCASAATTPFQSAATRVCTPGDTIYFHRTQLGRAMPDATAPDLRAAAASLELADSRYRMEVARLHLPRHMEEAAVSRRGLRLDGRTARAYGVITDLET